MRIDIPSRLGDLPYVRAVLLRAVVSFRVNSTLGFLTEETECTRLSSIE